MIEILVAVIIMVNIAMIVNVYASNKRMKEELKRAAEDRDVLFREIRVLQEELMRR